MTSPTRSASLGAPPRSPELGSSARITGLDGMRALAVIAVVVYHLGPGVLPGGFIGVDVFFVISGYLITSLLVAERTTTRRIDLVGFWKRRARRLLPALALVLVTCGAAAMVIGGNTLVGLGMQVVGAATFSSNWLSIAQGTSYFSETSPELFRNLWSLAVEEQFYLVWPIAILGLALIPRRAVRVIIVLLVAAASALAMAALLADGEATRVYYGTDTHSFGLAIGAAYAVTRRKLAQSRQGGLVESRRRAWWSVSLSVAGVAAFGGLFWMAATLDATDAFTYHGGLVIVSLLTVVVIADASRPESVLTSVLELRPMRWIGDRSYGLYLWHWPVFVLVAEAMSSWSRTGDAGWAIAGLAATITVSASALSYRFVEQPVRRRGFRGTSRAWFGGWRRGTPMHVATTGVATLAIGAMLAMTASATTMDPGHSDAEAHITQGLRAVRDAARTPTPTAAPDGAAPSGADMTAIGDSVMLAAAPQLQEQFPGIAIDAAVSRQMRNAPHIVRGLLASGSLRSTVVIGLGTNGPLGRDTLEEVRTLVGPARTVVFVNTQAPRGWVPGVNSDLSWIADRYRDVEVADWHDAIAPRLDVLASDQVHPGPTGGRIYSGAIAAALERHANLRPALDTGGHGLAPRAV